MKCLMRAALAWAFSGKGAMIFPLPPLGTVVTKEVLTAVRAEIRFGKLNVSEAILQHKPVCRLYERQTGGGRRDKCLSFGGTVAVDPRCDEKKRRNLHTTSSVLGDTVESHIGGMVCRFYFSSKEICGEVPDDVGFSLAVWWKR